MSVHQSKSELISKNVNDLIRSMIGGDSSPNLHSYLMRILASRLSPSIESDEQGLIAAIKRDFVKNNLADGSSKALSFANRYNALCKLPILRHRWSILYLLFSLRGKNGGTSLAHHESTLVGPTLSLLPVIKHEPLNFKSKESEFPKNHNESIEINKIGNDIISARTSNEIIYYQLERDVSFEESEQLLLRDLIFVFQGIDGNYIKYSHTSDGYVLDPLVKIPVSVRSLILQLSEVGFLYKKIVLHIERVSSDESSGVVAQAMCAKFQQELVEYYRLIALLESHINMNAVESGQACAVYGSRMSRTPYHKQNNSTGKNVQHNNSTSMNRLPSNQLTLRRLYVWMLDPLERLRIMASVAEGTYGLTGGALASAVYNYRSHGDPSTRRFIDQFVKACSTPIYTMITRWIIDGELIDPFNEFWVRSVPGVSDKDLWASKYTVDATMKPCFITSDIASQITLIGKSINFIRVCSHETNNGEIIQKDSFSVQNKVKMNATYSDIEDLRDVTTSTAGVVNAKLLNIIFNEYKLMEHLNAMKKFLLLGQGEFVQYLLQRLGPELNKRACTIYRHNLMAVLEEAIRGSNVYHESTDILERLDVRMMEASTVDTGWDVFSLDYKVDGALTAVIDATCQEKYQQIFTFLWKIKRLDFNLCSLWSNQKLGAKKLKDLKVFDNILHRCNILRDEMQHFINVFHNYVMFDVVERGWKEIQLHCREAENLDDLITAQYKYLDAILHRCLLSGHDELRTLIYAIFNHILRFFSLQSDIYSDAMEALHRMSRVESEVSEAGFSKEWKVLARAQAARSVAVEALNNLVSVSRQSIVEMSIEFSNLVRKLLALLRRPTQDGTATALRFLAFRLDFNEFYQKIQ